MNMHMRKKKQLYTRKELKIVNKTVDETVKSILDSRQGYGDVQCAVCGRQIGCPSCGQVMPEVEIVAQDEEDQSKFYCSIKCMNRKPEKEEKKSRVRRIKSEQTLE